MSKAAELANLIGNINAGGGGVNRNLVINGAMNVAQRSTSVSSVTSGGYKALDRYQVDYSGSHAWTISQDSNTPNGFAASMKFLCTTAQALTGSQRIAFRQKIEGHNLQSTKKGTSDAESVTASFHVKSNKTGTYILEYFDIDNQRHINKAYTVDTANTWEYKTITFEADTTGTFDNDANASAQLHFWLGAGSTYTSGTLQSSWGSSVTANRAVGNVNLADTVNNYWQITGIQLEVGQNPTTFEHEPFERTLEKCRRYYFVLADGSADSNEQIGNQYGFSTAQSEGIVRWGEMRASPSLKHPTGSNYYAISSSGDTTTFDNMLTYKFTQRSGLLYKTGLSITHGRGYRFFINNASAYVHLDAEL